MKKARPSLADIGGELKGPGSIGGSGAFAPVLGDILSKIEAPQASPSQKGIVEEPVSMEEEEL